MAIKLAIAGFGYWGGKIAQSIQMVRDFELTSILEVDPHRILEAKRIFPRVRIFQSWDEFVTSSNADALWIATPLASHARLAIQAVQAGMHVLIEKPIATDISQVRKIIEQESIHNKVVLPGHIFLHDSSIHSLKSMIEENQLGKIYYIDMIRTGYGTIRADTNVIWDLGVHDISIALFLLNEIPSKVSALGFQHMSPNQFDKATMYIRFPSEIHVNICVSWLEPARRRQISIVGSRGMAVLEDLGEYLTLSIYHSNQGRTLENTERAPALIGPQMAEFEKRLPATNGLVMEARHFANCILGKTTPVSRAKDGLKVIQILEALDISANRGRPEVIIENL